MGSEACELWNVAQEPAELAAADAWDRLFDHLARYAWLPALRFALDCDGAVQRCSRRACQLAGRCRVSVRDGKPIACGGGDLSDETLVRACGHVIFGCAMVQRFCTDIGIAPSANRDEPAPPASPSHRGKRR